MSLRRCLGRCVAGVSTFGRDVDETFHGLDLNSGLAGPSKCGINEIIRHLTQGDGMPKQPPEILEEYCEMAVSPG